MATRSALRGRDEELRTLDRLLEAVRAGESKTLVPPTLGSGAFAWNDNFEAPVGSLTVTQEIRRLAREATEQMPAAIKSFSDLAERL